MAMPSSPPISPETELPSSPPLLPQASFLPPPINNLRKRQLPEDESSLSSDPLFSEDPSEAEDSALYGHPRRKKMIKGPWWAAGGSGRQVEVQDETGTEKEGFRNMDSGVFMGSDLSSEMSIDLPDRALPNQRRPQSLRRFEEQPYRAVTRPVITEVQSVADRIIDEVVEAGKESFDLSSLGLTDISAATLAPIRYLTRQLHNHLDHAPAEEEFRSLTPEIKLFLAHNQLRRVPAELFKLEHLIALSVRNNQIVELSHAIGRLRKLAELNIAGNSIAWLPWELLDFLASQKQITIRPNPLLEPATIGGPSELPSPSQDLLLQLDAAKDARVAMSIVRSHYAQLGPLDLRSELELRFLVGRAMLARLPDSNLAPKQKSDARRKQLIFLAPSQIKYFEATGRPCRQPTVDRNFAVNLESEEHTREGEHKAPSLFECALQSAQRAFHLDALPDKLPQVVENALKVAADAIHYGNPSCTTCGRSFVIARAEWVEYWFHGSTAQRGLTQETIMPFMRRSCSWHCAQPTPVGAFRC